MNQPIEKNLRVNLPQGLKLKVVRNLTTLTTQRSLMEIISLKQKPQNADIANQHSEVSPHSADSPSITQEDLASISIKWQFRHSVGFGKPRAEISQETKKGLPSRKPHFCEKR